MRIFRIALWALSGILLAVFVFLSLSPGAGGKFTQMAGGGIGGPFNLTRTDGTRFGDGDLKGRPHALFFGFTNCPEVCPTTLWEASGWLQKLGADGDKITVVFVTVDPERDTREILATYMTSFDPRIIGLTGTLEEIEQIKKAYKVYSRKVPLEGSQYTVDHTATMYLMHGDGSFAGTIAYKENAETALEKLVRLIKNG